MSPLPQVIALGFLDAARGVVRRASRERRDVQVRADVWRLFGELVDTIYRVEARLLTERMHPKRVEHDGARELEPLLRAVRVSLLGGFRVVDLE